MRPKQRRMIAIGASLLGVAAAVGLVLNALEGNIVFFLSPSEVAASPPDPERRVRIGGLVKEDSVRRLDDGVRVQFTVTDMAHDIVVVYDKVLPDLFREGQGVVAEGRFAADGVFAAGEVLAKHDETYMPPEVADALKRAGHWKEGADGQ